MVKPWTPWLNKTLVGKKDRVKTYVRSGIRTHAHRSGLRPERSALDRSAILTAYVVHGKAS